MKVLIVSTLFPFPSAPWRGTFVRDHVHLLKDAGHDIRVIAPRPWVPFGLEKRMPNFRGLRSVPCSLILDEVLVESPLFRSLPGGRSHRWVARQLRRSSRKIAKKWNTWKPDVIHSHTILPSCHLAVEYGKLVDSPVVATVPGWDFDEGVLTNFTTMKSLLSQVETLFLMRESQREIADKLEYNKKTHVLPYPVIVENAVNVTLEPLWDGQQDRPFRILFPASPSRSEKNFDLFSSAIGHLRSSGVDIETEVLGGLDHLEVLDLLRQVDLVVYTSKREGAPIVAREAVALGTRVCGVNIGDLADWLPEFAISSSPTTEEVSNTILSSLSKSGDHWCLPAHFMPDYCTEKHIQVYREIIEQHFN